MKIVMLCGANPNQLALANKVAEKFNLAGLVVEQRVAKKQKKGVTQLVNKVLDYTLFSSLTNAWKNLQAQYKSKYPNLPGTKVLHTPYINNKEVVDFVNQIQPDLIIVSGTSLVRKSILDITLPIGMLNLHTGLSPYVKGGPNCTNWCLSTGNYHLIGNTIMWIDKGIDTGDILTTERTVLKGDENLFNIHLKVMEHAHDLYLRSVESVMKGNRQHVKQNTIAEGTTYYTRMWHNAQKALVVKCMDKKLLDKAYEGKDFKNKIAAVKTIPLS